MGSAFASAIITQGLTPASHVFLYDTAPQAIEALAHKHDGVQCLTSPADFLSQGVDVLIIALKPQVILEALADLRVYELPLLISLAAGKTIQAISDATSLAQRIARVMPNTPCLIGQGASAFAVSDSCTAADRAFTKELLACMGLAIEVSEEQLNIVTALSGSGPAYIYQMIDAMLAVFPPSAIPLETARALVLQTIKGAAMLMQQTDQTAKELTAQVTSPGGTTQAGLQALNPALAQAVLNCVLAAHSRAKELSV